MAEALQVFVAAMTAFNTLAPGAAQIVAVLRQPDGTEIPLTEFIDGVVSKNDANIDFATKYLATNPD